MKVKTKKESIELREVCSACQLPIGKEQTGSFTAWIFGGKKCKCKKEETVKSDTTEGLPKVAIEYSLVDETETTSAGGEPSSFSTASHKYEVIERLGEGGMGVVYKVKDSLLDQVYALKVLRSDLAVDPMAVERFAKEVRATESLSHPNVATVYDSAVDRTGRPFYVMEYVEGRTLKEVLDEQKTLSMDRLYDIAGQICEALSHAHQHGIVHRDLKPGNIILKESDSEIDFVKIVDFGIAKIVPPPGRDTMSLTKTGEIFGSPMYMSPEQCQGERLDARSDIYSLGCIMYECIAGRAPFQNPNPVKVILSHIYEKPLQPRSWRPGVVIPDVVSDVIMNCLEKDPNIRYQTMDELKGDIDRLRNNEVPMLSAKKNLAQKRKAFKWQAAKYSPLVMVALTVILILMWVVDLPNMFTYLKAFGGEKEATQEVLNSPDKQNIPFVLLAAGAYNCMKGEWDEAEKKSAAAVKLFQDRGDYNDCLYAQAVLTQSLLAQGSFESARKVAEDSIKTAKEAQFCKPSKGFRMIGWWYLPTAEDWYDQSRLIGQGIGDQYPTYYRDLLNQLDQKALSPEVRIPLEIRCATWLYKDGKSREANEYLRARIGNWDAKNFKGYGDLHELAMECYLAHDGDALERLNVFSASNLVQLVNVLSDQLENKLDSGNRFPDAYKSPKDVRVLANRLFEAGRLADVEMLLNTAIKKNPDDLESKMMFANFLSGRGEKQRSYELRQEIFYAIVKQQGALQAKARAVQDYDAKKLPDENLDRDLCRRLIANAYTDGSLDEAERMIVFFRDAIAENDVIWRHSTTTTKPSDDVIEGKLAMAAIWVEHGQTDKALNIYNEIMQDARIGERERGSAVVAKAILFLKQNKPVEAEAHLRRKLYGDDLDRIATLNLVKLYETQGRYQEASEALTELLKESSYYAFEKSILDAQKRVYEHLGDTQKILAVEKKLKYLNRARYKEFQVQPSWREILTLSDDLGS